MSTRLRESYLPADTSLPVLELTCGDLLREAAAETPNRVALVEAAPGVDGRSWTYEELLAAAERCALHLLETYEPGERLVVWAPNVPEWVVLQYGAALAGLVLVTANPALRAGELRYLLEQSRASGLAHVDAFRGSDMRAIAAEAATGLPALHDRFSFADWPERFDAAVSGTLPEVRPGDAAQIQYTSGTTGFPKGALLHHRGLVTNARYIWRRAGVAPGATLVSAMPLFHTAGCGMGVLGAANLRATYVLLQLFDPELMLVALERHRAEVVMGVPTMHLALLEHPRFAETDTSSVRVAMVGGSSVPPELVRRVERAYGCGLSTVYGQTELSPIVTQTSPDDPELERTETAGRRLWNVEVQIVDLAGNVVPLGEQGEICARGYQRMLEYFDLPDLTAETIDADGWLHTGDLGTLDERGYLRVTGRLKNMIIRGGENVYPAEIERVLFEHPQVADAVVVGVADEHWGERIAAVVRPADPGAPPEAASLHAFSRERLAPYKTPVEWWLAESFPLTGSGKVRKFEVVEAIARGVYAPLP